MQQAYSSWANLRQNQHSLKDTLEFLDQPLPDNLNDESIQAIPFSNAIELNRISFAYSPEQKEVFQDLSLKIPKGSRIGFIGETGSGKSTLLDIIMGLLLPTKGALEIDGMPITADKLRSWQKHVAHVPQSIFLADGSIAENIAFGIPKDQIDFDQVEMAAKQS